MGGAGAAYDDGMLGVIEDPWGGALALILIGLFFARTFRRLKIITVADFMQQRYGSKWGNPVLHFSYRRGLHPGVRQQALR